MTRGRGDRGSAAVELALVSPALIALMLLVVLAGRVTDAEATVRRAASEAARAASLRQHPGDAASAATSTVAANLRAAGMTCGRLAVETDTSNLRAGGRVVVRVRCDAHMSDVAFLGVPGTRTFESTSVEVVDTYRGAVP